MSHRQNTNLIVETPHEQQPATVSAGGATRGNTQALFIFRINPFLSFKIVFSTGLAKKHPQEGSL